MHIYKFTHLETGRCYIGQTIQLANQRKWEHISASKHTPITYHFHNALKKYGAGAFSFEVIAEASSLDELNTLEEKYINEFDSIRNGRSEKTRLHKKHIFTNPNKGGTKKESFSKGTLGWKKINGLRVWYIKEASV